MTEIRISVINQQANGGVFLTPFWFGFHDGAFDLFDPGAPASAALEEIAEDGSSAGLASALAAADADAQGVVLTGAAGPVAAGEFAATVLTVDGASNGLFDLAAMILPSNDAFIGFDASARLFDANGVFLGPQMMTITGADVYDAGTELNTELEAAFLNQTGPDTGTAENGVVAPHAGFNGSVGAPIGSMAAQGEALVLGGVNAAGAAIDPLAADFSAPGAVVATVHINAVARMTGTDGNDRAMLGAEDDIVSAGGGADEIFGGAGWDELFGGAGDDALYGEAGADVLYGQAGADRLFGGDGADRLDGGADADLLVGQNGADALRGGMGADFLFGGAGDDLVEGGAGADQLFGGVGSDQIMGGAGNDDLFGNLGADVFHFASGGGADIIHDFQSGVDVIVIDIEGVDQFSDLMIASETPALFGVRPEAFETLWSGDDASGVRITLDETTSVTLEGVSMGGLQASDFMFV
ncbi:MAG: spondin domain-containing protein [Pseudomonadota bacterium]